VVDAPCGGSWTGRRRRKTVIDPTIVAQHEGKVEKRPGPRAVDEAHRQAGNETVLGLVDEGGYANRAIAAGCS